MRSGASDPRSASMSTGEAVTVAGTFALTSPVPICDMASVAKVGVTFRECATTSGVMRSDATLRGPAKTSTDEVAAVVAPLQERTRMMVTSGAVAASDAVDVLHPSHA